MHPTDFDIFKFCEQIYINNGNQPLSTSTLHCIHIASISKLKSDKLYIIIHALFEPSLLP